MVKGIIFSKDRAMQVDATLRSFFACCQDPENVEIAILFTCTNTLHTKQYIHLAQIYAKNPKIRFIQEHQFHYDFVNILNPFIKYSLKNLFYRLLLLKDIRISRRLQRFISIPYTDTFVLFMVDDTIFTSEFRLSEICSALSDNSDALGFSLRLGKNISYSYMLGRDEEQPLFYSISDDLLKFRWIDGDMDFNYPLEVSSSLYRIGDVMSSLAGVSFNNPNLLEGGMNFNKNKFISTHPNLLCYPVSVAFCNPINIVQTVSLENRRGSKKTYDSNELAILFDQGLRINIDSFHHYVPNSCHVELNLEFNKYQVVNE